MSLVKCHNCGKWQDACICEKSLSGDGWRDCTKELPEFPEMQNDILLYTRKGYYTIGYYIGRFVGDGLKNRGDVIAWRPLPDPPSFTQQHEHHKCPIADDTVLGDEPPMTDIGLCDLELIACYDGGVYWFMDYRFKDDSGGAFLNSQIYKDDKEAIFALIRRTIEWEECRTEKKQEAGDE